MTDVSTKSDERLAGPSTRRSGFARSAEFKAMDLLYKGVGADVFITAEDVTLKFHRAIIAFHSPALAAIDEKICELKVTAKVLTGAYKFMYDIVPEQKTSLADLWALYLFADQYLMQKLVDHLLRKIHGIICHINAPDDLLTLSLCGKPSLNVVAEFTIDQLFNQIEKLGREKEFYIATKYCCLHAEIACGGKVNLTCCMHNVVVSSKARTHRTETLSKIYDKIALLPGTIQKAIFLLKFNAS